MVAGGHVELDVPVAAGRAVPQEAVLDAQDTFVPKGRARPLEERDEVFRALEYDAAALQVYDAHHVSLVVVLGLVDGPRLFLRGTHRPRRAKFFRELLRSRLEVRRLICFSQQRVDVARRT